MGSFVKAILEWTGPGVFTDSVLGYVIGALLHDIEVGGRDSRN